MQRFLNLGLPFWPGVSLEGSTHLLKMWQVLLPSELPENEAFLGQARRYPSMSPFVHGQVGRLVVQQAMAGVRMLRP